MKIGQNQKEEDEQQYNAPEDIPDERNFQNLIIREYQAPGRVHERDELESTDMSNFDSVVSDFRDSQRYRQILKGQFVENENRSPIKDSQD